jgi:leucyl-tRNA synthetase
MVEHSEPFRQLLTQGMVLKDGKVMSKSKGNVVDPDLMLQQYGADALRLYVMFVAPPENEVEWSDAGLESSYRFLARVWRLVDHWCDEVRGLSEKPAPASLSDAEKAVRRATHEAIHDITVDIEERQHLNTAVSTMMKLVNKLYEFSGQTAAGAPSPFGDGPVATAERVETRAVMAEAIEALVVMLSPFAPHTCEELWERLGHEGGLATAAWPAYDAGAARAEEIVVPVQVNGKLRGRITVPVDASEAEIREKALADAAVAAHVTGKTVKKVIVAQGKLVSVVVG